MKAYINDIIIEGTPQEIKEYINLLNSKQIKQIKNNNDLLKEFKSLAVTKGICPFPRDCKERFTCVKNYCHYDTCDNGHCYRMS